MPIMEDDDRYQIVTYWPRAGTDRHGNPTVGTPEDLVVRWQRRIGEMLNPDGDRVRVDGYLHSVEDIPIGSTVWLGGDTDTWTAATEHHVDNNVMEVIAFREIPDVRSIEVRKTYGLVKARALPNLVE